MASTFRQYWDLTKPRVVALIVFTALVGMCLAIEPMLVTGGIATSTLSDDWTVVTDDGGRASQWEHSVCRHDGGVWVLTAPDGGASELARFGVVPVPPGE